MYKKQIDFNKLEQKLNNGESITNIAKDFNVSRVTIYNEMRRRDIKKPKLLNENFFSCIDDEYKSYWLGFIMADGSVGNYYNNFRLAIHLKSSDADHLKKFHRHIDSKLTVREYAYGCYSCHTSDKLCNDLIKLGCVPNKTFTVEYPNIPSELDRHFIRGFLDGDGCIYYNPKNRNWKVSFLGTQMILPIIQEKLGTRLKIQKQGKIYKIDLGGNKQVKTTLHYLYGNSLVYLDRKFTKYKECYYS